MTYIQGESRAQMCLPEFIEDMVSPDNPARIIDSFVDSLDMQKLGFVKAKPAQTGRPAYDPKDLLKLYIYGYFNKIRSSRKLMQECNRNIELFFLLNRLTPDFRTISDFRKDNPDAIRKVFIEFARLCIRLNLYQRELFAVDGSKFRAVNGNKRMYNPEILKKKMERISVKLKEYMDRLDQEDQDDNTADEDDKEDHTSLPEKIKQLQERQQLYKGYLSELSETGQTQKLITDPEARMMHSHKDGFHCCYNVQTAVDPSTHLIGDYLVTNHINDQGILQGFSEQIKGTMGLATVKVLADKGYDCKEEIENCIFHGIIPYVGFKDDKEERLLTLAAVRMYGENPPVNAPPPGFIPHNSFFVKNRVEKTVLIRIRDDIPKQKERLCNSEHPFGTVKWYHGAHFVLCKGIGKTTAELGLSFLAYNLRRAVNMIGTGAILEGIEV